MESKPERLSKKFWLNNDGVVRYETGYECPPNDGCWWFPTLGYSTWSVFDSKEKAIESARKECKKEISDLKEKLKILGDER